MLPLLLALHAWAGPPPGPRLHYRLVNKSIVDIGMGMPPLAMTVNAFVSITLTDSASGHVADVTVEWSSFDGGAQGASIPAQLTETATGVTMHGFVRNGAMVWLTTSVPNLQAIQLVPAIQLLMAGTRSTTPGESWTDSTAADTATSLASAKSRLAIRWTATAGPGGLTQLNGTIGGTSLLGAGAMQLDLTTNGLGHATAQPGQLPITATSTTNAQGTMALGAGSVAVKVRTEVSATMLRPSSWSQIP